MRSTLGWWYIQWPSGSGSGVQTSSDARAIVSYASAVRSASWSTRVPGDVAEVHARLHFREELGVEHALGVGVEGAATTT